MTIIELLKPQLIGKKIVLSGFKNPVEITDVKNSNLEGEIQEYLLAVEIKDERNYNWLLKMNEDFHILKED